MIRITFSIFDFLSGVIQRSLVVGGLLLLLTNTSTAQTQTTTSTPTDGSTPLAIAPGAPAGSYPLSNFESINLYNGRLNLALPLVHVGGRGKAQMTMTLQIELASWRVVHNVIKNPQTGDERDSFSPTTDRWSGIRHGYGPGDLVGRKSGDEEIKCPGYIMPDYVETLTRLTYTAPDGTEFELRDQLTEGKPVVLPPCAGSYSRGKMFVTADGTSATFISDSDIADSGHRSVTNTFYPSGFLLLRDGTRYRIDRGNVSWILDGNGNKLSFSYDEFSDPVSVEDPLGRRINICYALSPACPTSPDDLITFSGFEGQDRTVRVSKTKLEHALWTDYTPKTYQELFPELDGYGSYNPEVISNVWLPNGKNYNFLYNSYGELVRVELPTGGAIEYEYGPTPGIISHGRTEYGIYRRVVERRVLPDGQNPEEKTSYTASYLPDPVDRPGTLVEVDHRDAGGTLLASEKHYFHGDATPSLFQRPLFYSAWKDGREYKTEVWNIEGTKALRRIENTWEQRAPVSWWSSWPRTLGLPDDAPPNDPRITEIRTTLPDTDLPLVATQTFAYDQYNNKTDSYEYDYAPGSPGELLRRSTTNYLTSGYDTVKPNTTYPDPSSTIHIRNLATQESVFDRGGIERSRTTYDYDSYSNGLVNRSNISGHDTTSFGTGYTTRGNVTAIKKWLLPSTSYDVARMKYDIAGNVVSRTDPRGYTTTIDYSDAFQYAYPTTTTSPVPDLNEKYGSKDPLITSRNYDFSTGLVTSATDPNNQTTTYVYNDALDRLTRVDRPDGGSTTYAYGDIPANLYLQSSTAMDGSRSVRTEKLFDGLGRQVETRTDEDSGSMRTQQTYDAMGRVFAVSNPFRTMTEETYGWTQTTYDALSRVRTMETFDRNGVSTGVVTTDYLGNTTTVTDQAGKPRRSVTDALGRLIRVDEPDKETYTLGAIDNPVQPTYYQYDALDNLVHVTQGSQHRYFMYDARSRLIRARNPEQEINTNLNLTDPVTGNGQWSMSYSYDGNGNLIYKTDARGASTNYQYDSLNRNYSRSYGIPTGVVWIPPVSYRYDGAQMSPAPINALGRLTQVTSTDSTTNFTGFDAMGRVQASSQTTAGQTYTLAYEYNLAGAMTKQTYPSGRVVETEYDAAGRVAGVKKNATGSYYAGDAAGQPNSLQYAPHGGLTSMNLGNTRWEYTKFNSRLQPYEIGLGASLGDSSQLKLEYTYNTPFVNDNNGNVLSQTITVGSTALRQNYNYDALNRLKAVDENGLWSQSYDYDLFGNRITVASSSPYLGTFFPAPAIDASTNRFISGSGFAYDSAGNLKQEPTAPGASTYKTYTYDPESRLANFSTGAGAYVYDGDGRRVKKTVGASTTIFVYNVLGQLVAEYTNTAPSGNGGTSYLTVDHLGSTRVVTDASGNVIARHDYLPFGEEIGEPFGGRTYGKGYGPTDSTRQRFTGKERDAESGLDYFGARYYASSLGRFMQTDPKPASAHMLNPQSWNRYAYTQNNPLKFVDPDGMDVVLAAGLSQKDRSYVVNNLARMYATPAGKGFLQRADQSKFTITVGTGHLGRTDLTKAPPGAVVFGGQTRIEGGNTRYGTITSDGHTQLVAKSPDSPTAPPIQVIIDKDQSAEIGKDPAKVFGHEFGGHTADVLNAAESNPNQFIDGVNPKDETSSEAAEKALGKVPNQPSQEDVQAVEEILKPKEKPKKEEPK